MCDHEIDIKIHPLHDIILIKKCLCLSHIATVYHLGKKLYHGQNLYILVIYMQSWLGQSTCRNWNILYSNFSEFWTNYIWFMIKSSHTCFDNYVSMVKSSIKCSPIVIQNHLIGLCVTRTKHFCFSTSVLCDNPVLNHRRDPHSWSLCLPL